MSRWFRHYAGMVRDDKLVRVAVKCGQPIERVVWVYGAILESAAEINDDGRYDFDAGEAAYFLRADEDDVISIEASLEACGRIGEGRVVRWGDRQFKSDDSSERVRRHRNKQKGDGNGGDKHGQEAPERDGNADVTATKRRRNGPETEAETEAETDTEAAQHSSEPRAGARPDDGDLSIPWGMDRRANKLDQLETELREAAGLEDDPSTGLFDLSPIVELLEKGWSLRTLILPKLREAKAKGKRGKTWRYYLPAITEAQERNAAVPLHKSAEPAKPMDWVLSDDPRWPELAANWKREKGRDPPTTSGPGGQGWHFPADWLGERAA